MPLFNYKPTVIDAECWDGTIEGAEVIRQLVFRHFPRLIIAVTNEMMADPDAESRMELAIRSHFVGANKSEVLVRERQWVVIDHEADDLIVSLYDDEFKKNYTPARAK